MAGVTGYSNQVYTTFSANYVPSDPDANFNFRHYLSSKKASVTSIIGKVLQL